MAPRFSYAYWTYARLFVKHNQPARHKCRICRPGRTPIVSQSTKVSTLVCSIVLSSPNFRSHPCSDSECVLPGPELPESFRATDFTDSSVMSTGMKIGVSSYVSNVSQEGIVLLGYFPSKTDATVSLIVPVQS